MRAIVYDQFGSVPQLREIDDPVCPVDGAVVRVAATGVCRSDWHAWMGHDPGVTIPHVPGHEFAGTVAEVGSAVEGWSGGDRVTAPFVCACGECEQCRSGNAQVCLRQEQPGFSYRGSFARYVTVVHAAVNLVRLPDDVDFVTAAALGCRFATSYRAVVHHGAVSAGQWVAVHGCGGVGLSAVMMAAARDARVVAVDTSTTALELARSVGAEVLVDASTERVVRAVRQVTSGGAHVSLDALGSTTTAQNSIRCLRPRGRHVQIGLLLGADEAPPIPMGAVIARELQLFGSHGMAAADYPPMLAEIAAGRLRPDRLVGRRITLDDGPAALAGLGRSPTAGLTVIEPT